MYCIDTDIIIEFFRGNKKIIDKINSVKLISITTISLCEIYRGAYLSLNVQREIDKVSSFSEEVDLIGHNHFSARIFGETNSKLVKIGKPTQVSDLMIASICIAHNKILVTKNKKHFENIPQLKIEEW